jgi:hypothetical protein
MNYYSTIIGYYPLPEVYNVLEVGSTIIKLPYKILISIITMNHLTMRRSTNKKDILYIKNTSGNEQCST